MKRKNNWNYFGVIALIVISAFMLISCPQQTSTLAKENPRELTLNYSGGSESYYYLNNNWYSDKECKNVVEDLNLQSPAAQTATITVNFDKGTAQATGDEYFQEGPNPFTWNFVKYVKAGDESKADYFKDGLKLPENGISENVTLTAEYDATEVVRKLPSLVKEGVTFGGYQRVNETVAADTPITVTPGLIATYNAIWTTYKTLTLNIGEQQQKLYYGSDNAWYKALSGDGLLLDENKVTGDDVKFIIPETPTWTVTFKKNTPTNENRPFSDADITLSTNQLTLYPKDGVFSSDQYISADGKVKVQSITENVNVTLDTSRRRPSEIVEATTPDSIKLVGWLNGDEKISDLSEYYVTADNISLSASWGYKVSIGELAVPGVGIEDVDRGFYTTTQDIDESVKDKSKQQRVAYYTEGETVKLYYCNDSIMGIEITLRNEWSGETKLINKVGHHDYRYSLLEIAPMVNQPLSISFKVTKSEQV